MYRDNFKYKFFTKNNGFSRGIYKGLNCGKYSEDKASIVNKNLNYALNKFGLNGRHLILPNQNHSNRCIIINSPKDKVKICDALVTKSTEVILGVTTADCLPIIFLDNQKKIIGVCHAGWRGISKGIIEETMNKMLLIGSSYNNINAIIGPCIRQKSYEIQRDFNKNSKIPYIENYILKNNDKIYLNLVGIAKKIMTNYKIKSIKDTKKNTYLDSNYFSYRESIHQKNIDYGRNLSLIAIK